MLKITTEVQKQGSQITADDVGVYDGRLEKCRIVNSKKTPNRVFFIVDYSFQDAKGRTRLSSRFSRIDGFYEWPKISSRELSEVAAIADAAGFKLPEEITPESLAVEYDVPCLVEIRAKPNKKGDVFVNVSFYVLDKNDLPF